MTSTGHPPGAAVPLPLAPDLDPADAAHIPRWLDELWEAEHEASGSLLRTVDIRRTPRVDLTPEEAAELTAYVRERWVDPPGQGERGGG